MATARDGLLEELRLLGASRVLLSTNIELRLDGLPYANRRAPGDAGVAVYYTWKDDQYVFSCDRWERVGDNVQAIRKTIQALRGIERWGTGDAMRAAFTGLKALPEAGQASGTPWWTVLGCERDATADVIRRRYKVRAMATHPDRGGTATNSVAVQEALSQGSRLRAQLELRGVVAVDELLEPKSDHATQHRRYTTRIHRCQVLRGDPTMTFWRQQIPDPSS